MAANTPQVTEERAEASFLRLTVPFESRYWSYSVSVVRVSEMFCINSKVDGSILDD